MFKRRDSDDVDLVEEPTANLRLEKSERRTGVKIGADEQLTDELQVHQLIKYGAAQTFVLKPSVIGGPQPHEKLRTGKTNDITS